MVTRDEDRRIRIEKAKGPKKQNVASILPSDGSSVLKGMNDTRINQVVTLAIGMLGQLFSAWYSSRHSAQRYQCGDNGMKM